MEMFLYIQIFSILIRVVNVFNPSGSPGTMIKGGDIDTNSSILGKNTMNINNRSNVIYIEFNPNSMQDEKFITTTPPSDKWGKFNNNVSDTNALSLNSNGTKKIETIEDVIYLIEKDLEEFLKTKNWIIDFLNNDPFTENTLELYESEIYSSPGETNEDIKYNNHNYSLINEDNKANNTFDNAIEVLKNVWSTQLLFELFEDIIPLRDIASILNSQFLKNVCKKIRWDNGDKTSSDMWQSKDADNSSERRDVIFGKRGSEEDIAKAESFPKENNLVPKYCNLKRNETSLEHYMISDPNISMHDVLGISYVPLYDFESEVPKRRKGIEEDHELTEDMKGIVRNLEGIKLILLDRQSKLKGKPNFGKDHSEEISRNISVLVDKIDYLKKNVKGGMENIENDVLSFYEENLINGILKNPDTQSLTERDVDDRKSLVDGMPKEFLSSVCFQCAICVTIALKLNETFLSIYKDFSLPAKTHHQLGEDWCYKSFSNYGLLDFHGLKYIGPLPSAHAVANEEFDRNLVYELIEKCAIFKWLLSDGDLYDRWLEKKFDMIKTICRSDEHIELKSCTIAFDEKGCRFSAAEFSPFLSYLNPNEDYGIIKSWISIFQ